MAVPNPRIEPVPSVVEGGGDPRSGIPLSGLPERSSAANRCRQARFSAVRGGPGTIMVRWQVNPPFLSRERACKCPKP